MAQRHRDIRMLNRLISYTMDSAENYRQAMSDVHSADLMQRFRARCRERLATIALLRDQVDAIGGDPKDDGTAMALWKRLRTNLQQVLHAGDWIVVQEVDRQEEQLKQKYDAALEDSLLSPTARETVLRAYESVRAGCMELAGLKRLYRRGER